MAQVPPIDLRHLNDQDPCPCGSGKKVGQCHKQTLLHQNKYYETQGRPIVSTAGNGKTFWAIGNRLFVQPVPNQTFHEFLFHYLADLVNRSWIVNEGKKPDKQQHHIFKCYKAYEAIRNAPRATTKSQFFQFKPDGATISLLTLAYDCYQMEHSGNPMPNRWRRRLRDREAYQGVRYEILVAALFCRMGFKLEFLEDVQKAFH